MRRALPQRGRLLFLIRGTFNSWIARAPCKGLFVRQAKPLTQMSEQLRRQASNGWPFMVKAASCGIAALSIIPCCSLPYFLQLDCRQ